VSVEVVEIGPRPYTGRWKLADVLKRSEIGVATLPHGLRPPFIALAALLGLLMFGDRAEACSDAARTGSCCQTTPSTVCKCCDPPSSSPTLEVAAHGGDGIIAALASTATAVRLIPRDEPGCQCRSETPVPLKPRPDPGSTRGSRCDSSFDKVSSASSPALRPLDRSIWPTRSGLHEPATPLYLRTLRVLI
jgi:hypothetical protein